MKRTILNFSYIALAVLMTSCNSNKKNEVQKVEESIEIYPEDTSRNALDWDGTYEGVLPCADCEGIKTTIVIHQDHTYTIKETYLGKDNNTFESEGTFEWDDKGQKITFSDADKRSYFVGENTLTHLDSDGNKIIGDMEALYILQKKMD